MIQTNPTGLSASAQQLGAMNQPKQMPALRVHAPLDEVTSSPTQPAPRPQASALQTPACAPTPMTLAKAASGVPRDCPAHAPIPLNAANLPHLAEIGGLNYDRSKLKEGIVHFGVGNFNRAHFYMYLHAMMNAGEALDWAVCGVGLLASDARMRDIMRDQDNLYTVLVDGKEVHLVGAMTSYLHAPSNPQAVLQKLSSPDTRIITMTVTEGGYFRSERTGGLDFENADVMRALQNAGAPQNWLEYMEAAAVSRMRNGAGGFTVMSCDNVQGNGEITEKVFLAYVARKNPAVLEWVRNNVSFPNSMVDRITPKTTPETQERVARHGIQDAWPVPTEGFKQFVIENNFKAGRPPFEKFGVQVVEDVKPYELMKLRLLNGSHGLISYLGTLAGYTQVHEVMGDPLFQKVIHAMMREEVIPTLEAIPDEDFEQYCVTLFKRFANTATPDSLARIAEGGSGKLPKFILNTIRDQLEHERPIARLALTVAAWCRYLEGASAADALLESLLPLTGQADATALLTFAQVFGEDLPRQPRFLAEVNKAFKSLRENGAQATLQEYSRS